MLLLYRLCGCFSFLNFNAKQEQQFTGGAGREFSSQPHHKWATPAVKRRYERERTWLWMYLVCRPCSSSPSPSTSSLYLGLIATMMSTDFCKTSLRHCSQESAVHTRSFCGQTYVIQKFVHPLDDAHTSEGIIKDVNLVREQRVLLWTVTEKRRECE